MKKVSVLIVITLMIQFGALGQETILGLWKTIDDETGKPKSVVEIFERDGKYHGKIVKLFREPDEDQDPFCNECNEDDDRYKKRVLGMEVLRDLEQDGDEYEDGTVMDPGNGSVYDCKIWIEGEHLRVRGYIAFLFRTQTWLRYVER